MPKKGHREEQIVRALQRAEAGEQVTPICRKLAISQATFYIWKKQYTGYTGMGGPGTASCGSRGRSRLKRLVADLSLDRQILQETVEGTGPDVPSRPRGA